MVDRSFGRLSATARRRSGGVVLVLASMVVFVCMAGSGTAQAGIVASNASECLSGEAGNQDLVAAAYGPWLKPIFLSCGDRTKGVLHIDLDHPIAEDGSDDDDLVMCFRGVVYSGDEVPAGAGNHALSRSLSDGTSATVVWDPKINEVVTMFTSDERSNSWGKCADDIGLWW